MALNSPFKFDVVQESPTIWLAIVTVPYTEINKLYKHASLNQKNKVTPYGFHNSNTPLAYIEKNFRHDLLEHLKEFLLQHGVVSFLYSQLRANKIVCIGDPRLKEIILDTDKDAEFYFELTPTQPIEIRDWKYIPFKSPVRKNYKDLDKQAESFIKEEIENRKKSENNPISIGDWVCFDIALIDEAKTQVLENVKENIWLKIGDEEPSIPYQEIFLDKKIGDCLYTQSNCFQEYFTTHIDSNYTYLIEIKDILQKSFFSLDYLKEHFRLKTNKSVHQKLIEVFSFRNDLSLRRAIVEELFDLFLSRFEIVAPSSAILRQQQIILDTLQTNPDYPVYKIQKGFNEKVKDLAEKQIKEIIFIEQLAHYENIQVNHEDIRNYLNLAKRPRTKEFIYFQHSVIKANEQDFPIPSELLKHMCLREKALNYAIIYLTR